MTTIRGGIYNLIPSGREWTDAEDALVMRQPKYCCGQLQGVAEKLGRTPMAIVRRRYHLRQVKKEQANGR